MDRDHAKRDRLRFFGKGNFERDVPIHPELRERLDYIFSTPPTSLATMTCTVRRLRDRVGAATTMGAPATTHAFRRTFGTAMYRAGARWEVADTVLGHLLPGAGARYIEIDWDSQVDAVNVVDYYAGQPSQLPLF